MKSVRIEGVSLLPVIVSLITFLSNGAHAATIRVEAWIDGRSQLSIKGNTAQWHHSDYAAPGRNGGNYYATIVNNVNWFPVWPDVPDANNNFCNCDSDVYSGVNPAVSAVAQTVSLNPIQARGSAGIIQQPSLGNDYTVIVEFDDDFPASADWYIVELDVPFTETPAGPGVPALDRWGLILLSVFLGGSAIHFMSKRMS